MDSSYQKENYNNILYYLIPRVEEEAKFILANFLDKHGLEILLNTYLQQPCRRVDKYTIVMNNVPIIISFEKDIDGFRTYKFSRGLISNYNNIEIKDLIETISVDINIIMRLFRIFKPDFDIITNSEDFRSMLKAEEYIDSETDDSFKAIRICHGVHGFAYSMLQTLIEIDKIKRSN